MVKLSFAFAAAIAVLATMLAPSLVVRAQGRVPFEYLRLTPYQVVMRTPASTTPKWAGYKACIAAVSEWTCHEFEDNPNGLSTALTTLGNEGWELVSAVDGRPEPGWDFGGLTYLFKRQRQ